MTLKKKKRKLNKVQLAKLEKEMEGLVLKFMKISRPFKFFVILQDDHLNGISRSSPDFTNGDYEMWVKAIQNQGTKTL